MNNRYGWICPQCGRVWAPTVSKCGPCEVVATGGHGIKHDWSSVEDDDEAEYCTLPNEVNCKDVLDKYEAYNSDWR